MISVENVFEPLHATNKMWIEWFQWFHWYTNCFWIVNWLHEWIIKCRISVLSPSYISLEADSKFEMSILRSVIVDLKAKLCFFQKKLNPLQWPREQRRSESPESTEPDMVPVWGRLSRRWKSLSTANTCALSVARTRWRERWLIYSVFMVSWLTFCSLWISNSTFCMLAHMVQYQNSLLKICLQQYFIIV